jgi:23S rRNA pseudouridine955/2504/2580 synthase
MQELVVPADESAKKLENFLKKRFPIGYVRKLFRKNGIRLNGQRAKASDAARSGDRIQLYIPFDEGVTRPAARRLLDTIRVIYEDESLLVIAKPAGLAVHEGKTISRSESLAGFIERNYRGQSFQPKLAHRLDKDTSGLVLLAKQQKTLEILEDQFASGKVDKEYLCLVAGRLRADEGHIDAPLPGRTGKLVRAVTGYRVMRRFADTSLLKVSLETGRLHQIRLHLAHLGHPVVLDEQHGDFNFNRRFRKTYGLKRQFLHAAKLAITWGERRYNWSAALPEDLAATLKALQND